MAELRQSEQAESGIEGNLPTWAGASACYSKAYRLLERMAINGGVSVVNHGIRGKRCFVGESMREIIDALNKGDEEQIKGLLLLHATYGH